MYRRQSASLWRSPGSGDERASDNAWTLVLLRPKSRRADPTGLPSPRTPGGLVTAVKHVGDVIHPFGTRRGIPRGSAQVDVTEAS